MSHVCTVDLEIKSLDDLEAACKRLGLELVRGQTEYRWFGRHMGDYPLPPGYAIGDLGKCSHAIRLPYETAERVRESNPDNHLPYEIGVVARRDGRPGYTLAWDFFHGGLGLQDFVGEDCNKLRQAYAVCAATRAARMQGMQVSEVMRGDGSISLQCRR